MILVVIGQGKKFTDDRTWQHWPSVISTTTKIALTSSPSKPFSVFNFRSVVYMVIS